MLPALSGIVQLGCLLVLLFEAWRYSALRSRTSFAMRDFTVDPFDPNTLDVTASATFVFRWDADARLLHFRRRFRPVSGEWGHAGGTIQPDGTVHWQPFPLVIMPLFALLALFGTIVLSVLESNPLVVLANPLVWLFCAGFFGMQVHNARTLLTRHLQRELQQIFQ